MALIHRASFNIKAACLLKTAARSLSTKSSIRKSVFISQSKDIHANLALQDWICKNMDMTDHHIMMVWQNDPCITIGRSRNPWGEVNVSDLPKITDGGVKLARQKTEGPSVYHDRGNLNVTFFTQKERFNEDYDKAIIARAIFREFAMKMDIFEEFKMRGTYTVSGTTSNIDEENAYHHCSLSVNINKQDRFQSLLKQEIGIQQVKNEESKVSKMMNLCDENSNISVPKLVKAIGWEYMRTEACTLKDGGDYLANQQKGFQMVNPTDRWFPGIKKVRSDLKRWEWLYGQTPDFKVSRNIRVPASLVNHYEDGSCELNMELSVSGGIIKDTILSVPPSFANGGFNGVINTVKTTLIGRRFSPELIESLQESIKNLGEDKMANTYIPRQIMTSF